jgi:hypothetical protein
MANKFNEFFSSFQSDKEPDDKSCLKYIYNSFNENTRYKLDNKSFTFMPTNEAEIDKLIKELDNKAAACITGISASILKATHQSIVPFLTRLFNDCINACVVLDEWKAALITVLHKKRCKR